ncbi:PREDICTED: protein phosphatase 1 regulatory subunit 16A-like [Amphimedon queenslandica]|uniref:Uncharacterized protein n=1 Tax=Amphimedon queenslandica TaxID=400682 RepID=A0A1X7VM54_AMPQE|nr:PREDICTED: protein phosphatase 1 regulatory subunit 16A-like [Amphimedon queenslandica]|eukprot:XP_011409906.2 PREDICTED: protein phosphatase 1 regulatory subunit 16A-like [Amphimedon queenslandica]
MADHEELIEEMPKLEKMSNAARLKLAKKRRQKQLKRYTETERGRPHSGKSNKTKTRINFEEAALLHDAVQQNNIEEVANLLAKGVTCSHSNADGLTPLHRCCIENTVDMAKLLIDNGADLTSRDIEGWTPLHAASACGNLPMINLLIASGANLVCVNHDDKMPVDVACDADIRHVIQQKMLEEGYTDDVCKYLRDSVPKTMLADLKAFVSDGGSVNTKDKYGASALHIAAANGYIEVMELILSQPKVNINIQDNEGWTPFHAAVCWEQREAMKLLAEKNADLEMQDIHGDTPFAVSDIPEIRQYILDLKAQFTAPMSISLTLSTSREDMLGLSESRGRNRSLSVRRQSTSDRQQNDVKRLSMREEKMMLQRSLEAEDIERTASGEKMDDDILLDDLELSVTSGTAAAPANEVKETTLIGGGGGGGGGEEAEKKTRSSPESRSPLDSLSSPLPPHSPEQLEEGMLERELEKALNPEKKDIVSILRNKKPTPVKLDTLQKNSEHSYTEFETAGSSGSLRKNRPSGGGASGECCVVL